ncbi:uncharacterized protein LOC114540244 [Dendronephthya gigantea]|uniref:uncharacterized protein LOC114540244 n=1 Tax=Dendronephthya gigantea TaxID=151771 RepID=UPI00106BF222|nr:uncharacterized protein LOC114540244 [Dendronephthya gigantea]
MPLPLKILFTCMDLPWKEFEIRTAIIDIMSEILPVYDGCLTLYHKSLWDWMTLNGYEEHAFVADVNDGDRRLWRACEKEFCEIESLKSVLEFQISPENEYALKNGVKYLMKTGKVEEFHWLVHVGVNYLRLKFCDRDRNTDIDLNQILDTYNSNLSKDIYYGIIQLHCLLEKLKRVYLMAESPPANCDDYLKDLANGYFDFSQNNFFRKNVARNILDTVNEIWMERVTNEENHNLNHFPRALLDNSIIITSSLSPDNTMFALFYNQTWTVQVLKIPSLATLFKIEVDAIHVDIDHFFVFSPDSSYILCNSIRSCILVKEQKEVPFIAHGPKDIQSCSFSSCGTKLATSGPEFIQVWDVMRKTILAEVYNDFLGFRNYCLFSLCGSYILLLDCDSSMCTNVLRSENLEEVYIEKNSVKPCLLSKVSIQIHSPNRLVLGKPSRRISFDHVCLPSGEIVLLSRKKCSKPFLWKGKKCVAFSDHSFAVALIIYDFLNQTIVDVFQIDYLPLECDFDHISKLEETKFILRISDPNLVCIISLESPDASFVVNARIDCCALSPDTLYVTCCFENCILSIRSIDNGETLQTVPLKQRAVACWWSKSYLWLVCEGVVLNILMNL